MRRRGKKFFVLQTVFKVGVCKAKAAIARSDQHLYTLWFLLNQFI